MRIGRAFLFASVPLSLLSGCTATSTLSSPPFPGLYLRSPGILTSSLSVDGGLGTVSLRWNAAVDLQVAAALLTYRLCASGPDPAPATFSTLEQVAAGNCTTLPAGMTNGTVSGLAAGHTYLFNVIVTDGMIRQVYHAKGEFLDPALVDYYPFEQATQGAVTDDVVSTPGHVANPLIPATGTPGSVATDRFGVPAAAWAFNGQTDCLMSRAALDSSLAGSHSRTIAFWLGSAAGQNPQSSSPLSYGSSSGTGSHFGLIGADGQPLSLWAGSEDLTTAAVFPSSGSAWQFWALTYDGNSNLYGGYAIDSQGVDQEVEMASYHPDTALATDDSPLLVGCGDDAPSALAHFFAGKVDDVRIFNRAMETDEIVRLYGVSAPAAAPALALDTAHYLFPSMNGSPRSESKAFVFQNVSSAAQTLGAASLSAATLDLVCNSDFPCRAASQATLALTADTCSHATLSPGQSCSVTVEISDPNASNWSSCDGGSASSFSVRVPYGSSSAVSSGNGLQSGNGRNC